MLIMKSYGHQESPFYRILAPLRSTEHEITIHSKTIPYCIDAEVLEIVPAEGKLVLEVEYRGGNIDQCLSDGALSIDIETLKNQDNEDKEVYNFDRISTRITKTDSGTYRFDCQFPGTIFTQEHRGAIRIPFILGMQARASVEVYAHELKVPAIIRNLSIGGCMMEVGIEESISLEVGSHLPGITIEFPNGRRFHVEGKVRHVRPFGNHGSAAVGVQFINLDSSQSEMLFFYVSESEREAAYRAGIKDKIVRSSPLFVAGTKEKKILQREQKERKKNARQSPIQHGVAAVAQQVKVMLMYMKNRHLFPEDSLYDCADTLLYLAGQDRKAFLYALALLREEPDWVRHAVQVAGELADMLVMWDPHSPHVREAVVGALLHTMGKPLLVSERLPSLKVHMKPYQKEILKGHVDALRKKLEGLEWTPSPTCQEVMFDSNECLDGSGYPSGKSDDQLSELVRLVSVIKVVNKLTHERNGTSPRAPLDAYRWVNDRPEAYDKAVLVQYIQHHGLYPIGSLAKFSGGFLARIMDVDAKGMPSRVNVIKNLSFKDTTIESVLDSQDFMQIGKFEGVVNPTDYHITHRKN